jgi:hypothetical protein
VGSRPPTLSASMIHVTSVGFQIFLPAFALSSPSVSKEIHSLLPPDAAARDGVGVLSLALSPACANSATSPRHTRPPPPLHVTPDHRHLCAIGSDQESSTAKAIERAPSACSRSPLDLGWFVCFYSPHSYLRPPLFVCCPCLDLSGCFVSLPLFVVDLSTHRLAHAFFSSLLLVDAACSLTHW